MDIQVKITIDKPAIQELAEIFRAALGLEKGADASPITAAGGITDIPQIPVDPTAATESDIPQIPQSASAETITPPAPVETVTPSYTLDDLIKAGMQLRDKGLMVQVVELLKKFNAPALPNLRPEDYTAFAAELRGLGADL